MITSKAGEDRGWQSKDLVVQIKSSIVVVAGGGAKNELSTYSL
jgi:hypothetical protein